MESEDEKDGAVVCVQTTPGQNVYSKCVQIPRGKLSTIDKLIKVGVFVSVDDGTSDQQTTEAPRQAVSTVALPDNVHISDLPDNMILETEWFESENRKTMRMTIKPEPNSFLSPDAIRFNLRCNYVPDEDEASSVSSGEAGTQYFSDMETEASKLKEKAVQTDIALGELLFSDSIASVSQTEVESVEVQTYITAINVSDAGEEGAEESEESIDEHEPDHGDDTEKTSAGEPQEDEEKDGGYSFGEKEENEEEGGRCACGEEEEEEEKEEEEEEKEEEEEEKEEEEEEKEEEEEENAVAVGDIEESQTEETQEAQEEESATYAAPSKNPSGIPLCLLRGDPPWVDPPTDTYTVMWDTNLELAPKNVEIQFKDTVDPIPSGIQISEKDPLELIRRSQTLSASFSVKVFSSVQSYFGSNMAFSSSDHTLKRDPELFNIHIDLNTWGFPASLYERYAKSTTASIASFYDDQPSSGTFLYMNEDTPSMYSMYNPENMSEIEDATDIDPTDTMSVGFIIEDGKPPSDAIHRNPPTKAVDAPEELQREDVREETTMVPEDMRAPGESNVESESPKVPRSISEEYFSTVEELQSSTEDTSLPEKDLTESVSLDFSVNTEKGSFELQWQEGLPVSADISPHKTDTLFLHPVKSEALKSLGDRKVPHTPERIKRESGCRYKTSSLDKLSHSTPQSTYSKQPSLYSKPPSLYSKPPSKLKYGALAKTLKDFEQQISPLHKALDDIKCQIQALEIEDTDILLSPVCSEDSSILSRSDSGYEQEIAGLISSAQREAITATFPCIRSSSAHMQCVCDPSTELFPPCCRKPCLGTDNCSMSGYMIHQRTSFSMPLDMGITYLVPTPIEMVTTGTWPGSSIYRTPSGCRCVTSPSEQHLPPKKTPTSCSRWTNET